MVWKSIFNSKEIKVTVRSMGVRNLIFIYLFYKDNLTLKEFESNKKNLTQK